MAEPYLKGTDPRVIRPGLERITALLERLGHPERKLRFVHVAGTNGKGSVSACIASILREAGYTFGLFTSPALERFSQRVTVNGNEIPDSEVERLRLRIEREIEPMEDKPTEFERSVALALLWFTEQSCDPVVLEVGLGGGEDATNVIPAPEVCVLTAMGLDHTRILGPTLTDIAEAKAGILKQGSRAVSYANEEEANAVFRRVCREKNIPLTERDSSRISGLKPELTGSRFRLAPYGEVTLALPGLYQADNALLAVTAVEQLRECGRTVEDEAIRIGLARVRWPGRFELLRERPRFLLDGSHNPHGLRATLDSLRAILPEERPVILMGVMGDKAVDTMLRLLRQTADRFVTVTPDNPRAMPAEQLAGLLRQTGAEASACASIEEGVRLAAAKAGEDGTVLALGTLYFSGAVRAAVRLLP